MVVAPSLGSAVVAEEHKCSVIGLGCATQKVEKCIVINEEVGWVSMLRADNIRSLDGIAAEEDWEVEANHVIITFTGVELDHKTMRITWEIRELAAQRDGTKAYEDGRLPTYFAQKERLYSFSIIGHLEKWRWKTLVYFEISCVSSKLPNAPLPQGWTMSTVTLV